MISFDKFRGWWAVLLLGCGAAPAGLPTEAPCAPEDDTCRIDRLGPVRLGWLAEGMAPEALVAKLGEPATREVLGEEGATGEWLTRLAWPGEGLEVLLSGSGEAAATVRSIWLRAPSTLATDRGIRVGSTADEARAAYAGALDPRAGEATIVAGSVYGGVIFTVEGGRVVEIFVGPAAE